MRVMIFASQKGGSGKTTLAGHVAVQAERAGAGPVALVDTDPQGSLSEWWNLRQAERPYFVGTNFPRLITDLQKLHADGVELVIVDTSAAIVMAIRDVAVFADLVVIPVRPSPHDLRAAGATVALVEDAGKPLVFVINGAIARARITTDAIISLSRHGAVAPVIVHNRVNFATSMIDGRTVMETDEHSRSAEEIAGLWDYLEGRLEKCGSQWTSGFFNQVKRLIVGAAA
ncbi:MAG: ParA family protein [Proteobacteria bacterium]|nr:ParA family protein [Pseudomonadota bacterium]